MLYMTNVARDVIYHSMEYEPKQILTWGRDCMCLGEIRKFHRPLLPVCSVLSVNSVNINQTWMLNMNFLCKLTIAIPQLPCLIRMAKAVSLTVELANSVTSDCVNWFNLAMWVFASKCFPIELVPCSDEWRMWWPMIHMMPVMPVSLILQCN